MQLFYNFLFFFYSEDICTEFIQHNKHNQKEMNIDFSLQRSWVYVW